MIHGFIDGKSRMIPVPGIRAHNNNRASTVLDLFMDSTENNGVPSRVRGDCGTENVLVAQWMEENQGRGRGSYIFGRLVSWVLSQLPEALTNLFPPIGVFIILGSSDCGTILPEELASSGKSSSTS